MSKKGKVYIARAREALYRRAIACWNEGHSSKQIRAELRMTAEEYGRAIDFGRAHRLLNNADRALANGLPKDRPGIEWSKEMLCDLYHGRGMTLRQIAAQLRCDVSTVHGAMDRFGIDRRPIGPVKGAKFDILATGSDFQRFPRETEEQAAMWCRLLGSPSAGRSA
ncbi:MAG TPA: hypothetical protein VND94_00850 [Terriglobia bacterium]|nr:hypothetical protein [Terriglobia bacterium]